MVNLHLDQGHRRFEGPDADLPEEHRQDAPILLSTLSALQPCLQFAEYGNTGSHAIARPTQLEYASRTPASSSMAALRWLVSKR